MICPFQINCTDYKWGHKIRSHHVREVNPCVRLEDKSCPFIGTSCDIRKMKRLKNKLKEV